MDEKWKTSLVLRPTSVIRKTDIFSPDQWNLVPDHELETPDHFLIWFYTIIFCSDRNTKFPKIPPDRMDPEVLRAFRIKFSGWLRMTEVGCCVHSNDGNKQISLQHCRQNKNEKLKYLGYYRHLLNHFWRINKEEVSHRWQQMQLVSRNILSYNISSFPFICLLFLVLPLLLLLLLLLILRIRCFFISLLLFFLFLLSKIFSSSSNFLLLFLWPLVALLKFTVLNFYFCFFY